MTAPAEPEREASVVVPAIRTRIVGHAMMRAGDLLANPQNFRIHPKAQRDALRGALDTLGWVKSVIVNETTGHVLDGHARVEDALGRSEDELVPVQIVKLTEDEERLALAILDPMAELAVRDDDQVAALLKGLEVDDDGLGALLAQIAEDAGVVLPEPIEPPAPDPATEPNQLPPEPITKPGDVIRLGWHVLMCGDALDDKAVDELLDGKPVDLIVTDPPYAVYGSSTGIAADITDDTMVRPMFRGILRQAARVLKPFGHLYVCCDWRSWSSWWEVARGTPVVWKNCIIWDKGGAGLGSNYANTHEFLGFGSIIPMREGMTQKIVGIKSVFDTNVWKFDRVRTTKEGEIREHNAQKPVPMLRRAIENSTEKGETVLDLFGGSGSTLIAAEQVGRICYMMEHSPAWCDTIVARFERSTGIVAQRPLRFPDKAVKPTGDAEFSA